MIWVCPYMHFESFFQLAGNFVKNTRKPAVMIMLKDIQMSMSADPVSLYVDVHHVMCHVICYRLYKLFLSDPFSLPLLR